MSELEHPTGTFSMTLADGWEGVLDEVGALTLTAEGRRGALWIHAFPLDDEDDDDVDAAVDEVVDEVDALLPGEPDLTTGEDVDLEGPGAAANLDFSRLLGLDAWRDGVASDEGVVDEDTEDEDEDEDLLPRAADALLARWAADAAISATGPVMREQRGALDVAWVEGQSVDAETGAPETGRYWVLVRGEVVACVAHTWPRGGPEPELPEREEVEAMLGSLTLRSPASLPLAGFASLVADALREARPDLDVRVERSGAIVIGEDEGRIQLDNQWRQCGGHPDAVESLAQAIAESVPGRDEDLRAAPPLDEVRERLRPLLKLEAFLRDAPTPLLSRPFVAGLVVCYVVDSPRTVRYVMPAWLREWALTEDGLHALALSNLARTSREVPMQAAAQQDGRVELLCWDSQDGYDAARVLVPDLHRRLREHLGQTFLVGVPNRDFLVALREDDEELVRHCRQMVAEHARTMPYPLYGGLLRVSADGVSDAGM